MPQHLEAGEPRQQGCALGAKFFEIPLAAGFRVRLELLERRSQRAPFQSGDGDIVDNVALLSAGRARRCCAGIGLKIAKLFDVDIERVEKQPAVGRIWAAIGRAVVEQRMQRIEADAVGAQMIGKFDQPFKIGEIANSPVARRADAIKLDREQPAAVEIAAECLWRRHNQWGVFSE